MALELVAQLQPNQLTRESTIGYEPGLQLVSHVSGDVRGLSLPKLATQGYTATFMIPGSLTMGTGLTFRLPITDDGTDANDLGKVVRLGVTIKRLTTTAETTDMDTNAGTEQTVDVTLDATTGEVVNGSLAVTTANLDSSVVVGDLLSIRIRRVSTHANDTCNGRVILLGAFIFNT